MARFDISKYKSNKTIHGSFTNRAKAEDKAKAIGGYVQSTKGGRFTVFKKKG